MGPDRSRGIVRNAKLNNGKPYEQMPPASVGVVDVVASRAADVLRPAHYGGKDAPYEAIKVIEAWGLGFNLGNAVKYISRAGKKDPAKIVEDLMKARTYIDFEIERQARGTK